MFENKGFLVLFLGLLLIPMASNSEATLQELTIYANMEKSLLFSGDRPIVSGVVTDHASKPINDAQIIIRSGSMSIITTTSENGQFLAELGKHDRLPGIYDVNISATSIDGKKGLTSIQFQVKGELNQTSVSENKLSTPEAQKYLSASPEDFEKNPIGFMLYNYYQKLYQEYLEEQKIQENLESEQAYLVQQKEVANQLLQQQIEEENPGYGMFSGYQYERYIGSLDDDVKPTIVEHLNFTKNLFEEGQRLKAEILASGGTVEEANAAYLEKMTTGRAVIESLGSNPIEELGIENSGLILQNNTEKIHQEILANNPEPNISDDSPIIVWVDEIKVEVDYQESIFFVNVNGTILEFLVNGTNISLVNGQN